MDENTKTVLLALITMIGFVGMVGGLLWYAANNPVEFEPYSEREPDPTFTYWLTERTYDDHDNNYGPGAEMQEYRDRLAAALWANRRLARESRQQEKRISNMEGAIDLLDETIKRHLEGKAELSQRIADLEADSVAQENRIQDALQRYAASHTQNGVLGAQIADLQAMTRELRRQVARYEDMEPVLPDWAKEIQQTMRQWEGGK